MTAPAPSIYIIGDSISLQYGTYLERILSGKISYSRKEGHEEAMLNLDKPAGANGGDSSMVLEFLTQKTTTGGIDIDYLLVNCGLHDIKTDPASKAKQVSIADYTDNLVAIVRTVSEMGLALIWIRTTPCDESVHNHEGADFHRYSADCDAYNASADQVMHNSGIPTIDLHTFTSGLGDDLYCDHVHFHEHIREQQARFIADWLMDYIKQPNL